MDSGRFRYVAYGLRISSDVALPELRADSGHGVHDVRITVDALPEVPALADAIGLGVRHTAGGTYLRWKDVGSFRVCDGKRITCDPAPSMSAQTFRLPLLGVVMGVLLHQRGLLTLHASAVAINGEAVAFIGWKGAGKSTTAAALQARGHTLITDDVLALESAEDGDIHVLPAFPQIKLWPESAAGLGYDPSALPALDESVEKRALRPVEQFATHPLPLGRIYFLDEGTESRIKPITGGERFTTLLSQAYAPRFLGSGASTAAYFNKCQRLARHVPLYRLTRAMDFSRMREWLCAVEDCTTASDGAAGRLPGDDLSASSSSGTVSASERSS